MANITVSFADGQQHVYSNVPDNITPDQIEQRAAKDFAGRKVQHLDRQIGQTEQPKTSMMQDIGQGIGNIAAGAVRGAGSIGATVLAPADYLGLTGMTNAERRKLLDTGMQYMGAEPESMLYGAGKLAGEIAGTAGAGGAVAKGVMAGAKYAPNIAPMVARTIETGGMATGAPSARALSMEGARNAAIRVGGGAVSGATMAGMINHEDAGVGAMIGGGIPVAGKFAGKAGKSIRESFIASPEVAQLAQKAKALGIDIPADRLANSKMLDATAASLNYVPFSGRIATETNMNNQIKKALSNTFGENTEHLSKDLIAKTQNKLGDEFDKFLTGNTVKVDQQLWTDLQGNLAKAKNELSADNYRIVENQVKDLWSKINNGVIDGQAAYNVKKTLDRLGRGNGNEAFHAKQVRDSLMNGVLRSVQPDEAAAFTALKRKYANLKTVEKLAGNTAEGEISMARLGNLDSRNPEVSDIAKIAATFAKGRESPHGAMQRVTIGSGVAALGGGAVAGLAAPVAVGLTGGRLANMALNSNALKKLILAQPQNTNRLSTLLTNPAIRALPQAAQSR